MIGIQTVTAETRRGKEEKDRNHWLKFDEFFWVESCYSGTWSCFQTL